MLHYLNKKFAIYSIYYFKCLLPVFSIKTMSSLRAGSDWFIHSFTCQIFLKGYHVLSFLLSPVRTNGSQKGGNLLHLVRIKKASVRGGKYDPTE